MRAAPRCPGSGRAAATSMWLESGKVSSQTGFHQSTLWPTIWRTMRRRRHRRRHHDAPSCALASLIFAPGFSHLKDWEQDTVEHESAKHDFVNKTKTMEIHSNSPVDGPTPLGGAPLAAASGILLAESFATLAQFVVVTQSDSRGLRHIRRPHSKQRKGRILQRPFWVGCRILQGRLPSDS